MPRTRPLASRVGDRRSRRAAALATAAAVLACTLTACTPPAAGDPGASDAPAATSSAAPIFASDEEALAAAVAAYERFLEISTSITGTTEYDIDKIRTVSTQEFGQDRVAELSAFMKAGLRTEGAGRIDTATLAELSQAGGVATVSIYACQDVTDVRLFNEAGQDVTPADRDNRIPLLLSFEGTHSTSLVVSGNQLWSGDDFC